MYKIRVVDSAEAANPWRRSIGRSLAIAETYRWRVAARMRGNVLGSRGYWWIDKVKDLVDHSTRTGVKLQIDGEWSING